MNSAIILLGAITANLLDKEHKNFLDNFIIAHMWLFVNFYTLIFAYVNFLFVKSSVVNQLVAGIVAV